MSFQVFFDIVVVNLLLSQKLVTLLERLMAYCITEITPFYLVKIVQ